MQPRENEARPGGRGILRGGWFREETTEREKERDDRDVEGRNEEPTSRTGTRRIGCRSLHDTDRFSSAKNTGCPAAFRVLNSDKKKNAGRGGPAQGLRSWEPAAGKEMNLGDLSDNGQPSDIAQIICYFWETSRATAS